MEIIIWVVIVLFIGVAVHALTRQFKRTPPKYDHVSDSERAGLAELATSMRNQLEAPLPPEPTMPSVRRDTSPEDEQGKVHVGDDMPTTAQTSANDVVAWRTLDVSVGTLVRQIDSAVQSPWQVSRICYTPAATIGQNGFTLPAGVVEGPLGLLSFQLSAISLALASLGTEEAVAGSGKLTYVGVGRLRVYCKSRTQAVLLMERVNRDFFNSVAGFRQQVLARIKEVPDQMRKGEAVGWGPVYAVSCSQNVILVRTNEVAERVAKKLNDLYHAAVAPAVDGLIEELRTLIGETQAASSIVGWGDEA